MTINKMITSHVNSLSAWASVVTLISLPLVVVGFVLSYFQLREALTNPDPHLEFVHSESVSYIVINRSTKLAENVLISFGIFDLDSDLQHPVPVMSQTIDYVNSNSKKGPMGLFQSFASVGHRYFGIVYVSCKQSRQLRTYWLYVTHGEPTTAFYAERQSGEPFNLDLSLIASKERSYLDQLVSKERRIPIGP